MNKIWTWMVAGVLAITVLVWYWEAPRFSGITEGKVLRIRRAIQLEIQSPAVADWAGEYCAGEMLGENIQLAVAPKAGFVFERHGSGGLYDRNYGSVEFKDNRLALSFKFKNEQKGVRGIWSRYFFVRWGERHYLIPANDLAGFCDVVRSGREPRNSYLGRYFLKRGDEDKPVSGKPDLPGDYGNYL
jgi:hypothetical protein